ncbi:heparinase [Maribellus comscasis]|uniref:Heparinase n=1 Tax=Maribellus comscasis TaxID=2681766 RepID=A0A6I6JI59_9BACT|nr:alginate lyase family protein [Maribellus comscasis]QGY42585.1 heparinase [Maribellus comscasis]
MKKYLLFVVAAFIFWGNLFAQKNWKDIKSVEDVCSTYPEQMKKMLDDFNLDYPGLEKVRKAYQKGNIEKACAELLEYYKNGNAAEYLRREQPVPGTGTVASADTILKNVFTIQNVKGVVPYLEDGHRDWYFKGPNTDEEWAWLSNRHSQISEVFLAYFKTGNPEYANYIDLFLRDFIIGSWPYPEKKSSTSVWRGLEVAARVKVWSRIFYGMINSNYLSPATQLLMLSSLPDHAHYNRNFHAQNNWLTMEISALATAATNFPEFKKSDEWLDYAIVTISESMKGQVYKDGVQTELTSHYHNVAMRNFELFEEICEHANRELPEFFVQTIGDMYYYIAHAVRPDGDRILNNDGDRGSDRDLILHAAEKSNRPDWKYIATNGKEGTLPKDGPSYFFPWAGHLISRSGFDADAQWSFFDVGPWGSGHQHNDKLHISVAAFGRDLLVDGGRFAYRGAVADKFRKYAQGSQSHNVIMIDGKGQAPGPRLAEEPLTEKYYRITDDYDYAIGSFDDFIDLQGECKHTRRLFYVRGDMWVVIDEIETDRPREIEALWHWHPNCNVKVEGENVFTDNERGNLRIVPVGEQEWNISFVNGREEPEIQGWYSEEYNTYESNTASIYSTRIEGDSKFIWVLFPSENVANDIKAEIISETNDEMKLRVFNSKNDEWFVTIPL